MKRLLGVEELDADRVKIAEDAAERWGQIVVLKGATTVVAEPAGRTMINDSGNPALATAGTGDVLAGAIAGLLAQGLAPFEAAALGVYLHGAAGRLVREDLGDMGAIASDLLPRLPLAIKALKQ
jgi:NAD(P)H-hydrate epimerase